MKNINLKGQSNEVVDPHFFIIWPAWGIILRRVNLPAVSYCGGESCDFSGSYSKDPKSFPASSFYHQLNSLPGPLTSDQWVKICSILVRFRRVMLIFPKNLPALSYLSHSPHKFHTAGSNAWSQPFLNTFTQAFRGTVSQKEMWILILHVLKRAFFLILQRSSRIEFCFTPRSMTRGSQF